MLGLQTGTLAAGKQADLLVLDDDPLNEIANTQKIAAVVHNGVVVRAGKAGTNVARNGQHRSQITSRFEDCF